MKRLLATGLLLLLASVPLFAQEKVAIVPPPSADTSAAADAESTSATPGEKTALPSAQEITRTLPAEPGKEPQLNEHEIAILNPETQEWRSANLQYRKADIHRPISTWKAATAG